MSKPTLIVLNHPKDCQCKFCILGRKLADEDAERELDKLEAEKEKES